MRFDTLFSRIIKSQLFDIGSVMPYFRDNKHGKCFECSFYILIMQPLLSE